MDFLLICFIIGCLIGFLFGPMWLDSFQEFMRERRWAKVKAEYNSTPESIEIRRLERELHELKKSNMTGSKRRILAAHH